MLIFPDDIADPPLCAREIPPKVRARFAARSRSPSMPLEAVAAGPSETLKALLAPSRTALGVIDVQGDFAFLAAPRSA